MADRTMAAHCGKWFKRLAVSPTDEHKAWAAALWSETRQYDFSPYQMNADEALVALGLATPGDDGRLVYAPRAEWERDDA